ncbi:MAG: hypothetical protein ACFFB7_02180 [Candidatus Sifarchaeia archaeon]
MKGTSDSENNMGACAVTNPMPNWFLVLAIIGLCMIVVYETWVALRMNWLVPPSDYPNILFIVGLVLVGLGLHALYLIYTRILCRIASLGFIIVPLAFVPVYLPRNPALIAVFGTAGFYVVFFLGALAFYSLRGERTKIFRITSFIVLFGALSDILFFLLAFALSSNVPLSFGPIVRIAMWISMAVTIAWVYRNNRSI